MRCFPFFPNSKVNRAVFFFLNSAASALSKRRFCIFSPQESDFCVSRASARSFSILSADSIVISSRDGACGSPAISTVVSGAIDAWICPLSTYHLRVRRSANRSLRPMTCVSTLLCISVLVSSSSAQSGVWCIFERSDFCSCEVLFSSLERRL